MQELMTYEPEQQEQSEDSTSLFDVAGVRFHERGLELPPNLPFDVWQRIGDTLKRIERGIQFAIGDWLNYGERTYGQMYSQALEATDYAYGSLADMKWVAARFQSSDRSENLPWTHHRAVAALPKPDALELLHTAECERWSRPQLHEQVRVRKEQLNPVGIVPYSPPPPGDDDRERGSSIQLNADYEVLEQVLQRWPAPAQKAFRDACRMIWNRRYFEPSYREKFDTLMPDETWFLYRVGDYMHAAKEVRRKGISGAE